MKLPVVSGEETIKALYKAGFRVVRQKGSHVRMEKKTDEGTLRIILKQAGLSVEEFLKLL